MNRLIRRKKRGEKGIVGQDGFPTLTGRHYLDELAEMHARLKPRGYLEIGSEKGPSLSLARCPAIAIDPMFQLGPEALAGREVTHLLQMESDRAFAEGHVARLGLTLDLQFLDGMHLYEFLLRDFINAEAHAAPGGTIVMHDCVPMSELAARRDWDRAVTKHWVGDVWKLVPILRRWRPDLEVEVLRCPPSGLVVVTGLDPKSTVLRDAYEAIRAEWDAPAVTPQSVAAELAAPPASHRRVHVKLPGRDAANAERWGETPFGLGVGAAFARRGYDVEYDLRPQWGNDAPGALHLAITAPQATFAPSPGQKAAHWLLLRDGKADREALARSSHVFCASPKRTRSLAAELDVPVSALLQGFDRDVMRPDGPAEAGTLAYVARRNDRAVRRSVRLALAQGIRLHVHGPDWEGAEGVDIGTPRHLSGPEVAAIYRGAQAVVNDHRYEMGPQGYVSNRIFDALACGAPVVTDPVSGCPEDILPWLHVYGADDGFGAAVAAAAAEDAARREARRANAEAMRDVHSFDARVAQIIDEIG
ncbi:MAG: glycosyltransferase family protein [Hasllibacter sp.]